MPLKAQTLIQAQAELEKIKQNRTVPPRRRTSPISSNYWPTYISQIHQLKRPRTVDSEKLHCEHWTEAIGRISIHLIRKSHLLQYRSSKLKAGWTGRTVNLAITVLSNVLNQAQDNGLIDTLPTTGLKPIRWKPKKSPLFALEQIEANMMRCWCKKYSQRAASSQLRATHEDLWFPGKRNASPPVVRRRLGQKTNHHWLRWSHQKP